MELIRREHTHFHPSASTYPSQTDDDTFNDIRKLSKMMNLNFLDSIIVGDGKPYSYKYDCDDWNN